MTGAELFRAYTAKRDYSGSQQDEYAQLLMTIFSQISSKIFPLLEEAERLGKKLDVKTVSNEITAEDIILVS